jgi:hypothetical protein
VDAEATGEGAAATSSGEATIRDIPLEETNEGMQTFYTCVHKLLAFFYASLSLNDMIVWF